MKKKTEPYNMEEFAEVIINEVEKSNNELKVRLGKTMGANGEILQTLFIADNCWPAPYKCNLNELYLDYVNGKHIHQITEELKKTIFTIDDLCSSIDLNLLNDYDKAKSYLHVALVPVKGNEELINYSPHKVIGDMAMLYRFVLPGKNTLNISLSISNNKLANLGVSEEQLYNDAIKSSQVLFPGYLYKLDEDTFVPDELSDPPIYAIDTKDNENGAIAITYPDFLESVSMELGCEDLFIFPKYTTGALVLGDNGELSEDYLEFVAENIYAADNDPSHILSDKIYYYDNRTHVLDVAKFEKKSA